MIRLFKIKGDSLYPVLKDGQIIVAIRLFKFMRPKVGDIAVFTHSKMLMIKIIKSIDEDGFFMQGTQPQSIDSRDFGKIRRSDILYIKLFRLI